jgi:hypothetical protein
MQTTETEFQHLREKRVGGKRKRIVMRLDGIGKKIMVGRVITVWVSAIGSAPAESCGVTAS